MIDIVIFLAKNKAIQVFLSKYIDIELNQKITYIRKTSIFLANIIFANLFSLIVISIYLIIDKVLVVI